MHLPIGVDLPLKWKSHKTVYNFEFFVDERNVNQAKEAK